MEKFNLITMYKAIHDDDEAFPAHINGSKIIDCLSCTPNLIEYTVNMGYIQLHEWFESEPQAFFCDISDQILKDKQQHKYSTNIP
jgi:hypothetical protein